MNIEYKKQPNQFFGGRSHKKLKFFTENTTFFS